MDEDKASIKSRSEIQGREYIELEIATCCSGEKIEAIVDAITFLPLRESHYQDGHCLGSVVSQYRVFEILKKSESRTDIFENSITNSIFKAVEKMDLVKARSFTPFRLFFVGDSFQDLIPDRIIHNKTYPLFSEAVMTDIVLIHYGNPDDSSSPGQLWETYVSIENASPDIIETWEKDGRSVQNGILRETSRQTFMKEILRDGVLITLWNNTEKGVLDMEEALQKLE